ncbi:MAG: VOC family protein [Pseudomonadota bacterium]
MTATTDPFTLGVHHVGLTVPSLNEARAFFLEALGYTQVGEKPDYPAAFVSDGITMLTLWQADDDATAFDRRQNIGLHHLALRVPGDAALDALHATLTVREDARIEFAPEPLGTSGLRHMMVRIPGNVRVEFIAA